ncbi:ABC transporter ATP-binding protein [Saccharomonospora iraqiensis]|uniref:ABC transporter ATP-binding protein n=1 Tax=Saccharomonospora iraqiensis TaxID=52698 RepID=UPI000425243F|nr:ABC transporter ATP-binding protein [Saccharomonospora iraqiensis]
MTSAATVHLRPDAEAVLSVRDLVVKFPVGRRRHVHAVSGVSFDLLPGETLGILGESGCGKSTAGRAAMQLPPPTAGSVRLAGTELTGLTGRELRRARRPMQMILQDPVSSLNPRRTVADLVAEGAVLWGPPPGRERIEQVLSSVGLDPAVVWHRRPHELSGGQCQRVCLARALLLEPRVLICDEPVSSLDVSVQAQILNLLESAKDEHGLSMVFIAHDLAVVNSVSDRIMVMYLGKVCEVVPSGRMRSAAHPYTRLLLESVPDTPGTGGADPDGGTGTTPGSTELPSPLDPPSGCRFRTRCPWATGICAREEPPLRTIGTGHHVACHHVAVDGDDPARPAA